MNLRATLDSDVPVKIDILFGHIEIVSTRRWDGPYREILGGYAIFYDRDGKETSRTEDTPNIILTYPQPECRRWWEFWK